MDTRAAISTKKGSRDTLTSRRLFSRDLNYLRDLVLVWPFVICSIAAASWMISPDSRKLALRCAALAVASILLARERLLCLLGAMGFVALQGAWWLVIRPWSWSTFAATVSTGVPFLLANRYWRNPKFSYQVPDTNELGAIDVLLSFASICGTIFLMYLISPRRLGDH